MGGVKRWTTPRRTATWPVSQLVEMAAGEHEHVSTWSADEVVEQHDGYWTVQDPVCGVFGSGPDQASAIEDFQRALREHLDVLSRQEALSPDLLAQLAYLRDRLS